MKMFSKMETNFYCDADGQKIESKTEIPRKIWKNYHSEHKSLYRCCIGHMPFRTEILRLQNRTVLLAL